MGLLSMPLLLLLPRRAAVWCISSSAMRGGWVVLSGSAAGVDGCHVLVGVSARRRTRGDSCSRTTSFTRVPYTEREVVTSYCNGLLPGCTVNQSTCQCLPLIETDGCN